MLDTYLDTTLARLERIARDAPDLRPAQIDAVVQLAIRVLAADLAHRAGKRAELARLAPTIRVPPLPLDFHEVLHGRVVAPRELLRRRFAPLYSELRRIALALAPGDDALRAATHDDLAVFRIRLHLTGVI